MFIENAKKGSNGFWLYVAGIFLVIVGYFLGSIPIIAIMAVAAQATGASQKDIETLNFDALGIDLNTALFLNLIPFAVGVLAL